MEQQVPEDPPPERRPASSSRSRRQFARQRLGVRRGEDQLVDAVQVRPQQVRRLGDPRREPADLVPVILVLPTVLGVAAGRPRRWSGAVVMAPPALARAGGRAQPLRAVDALWITA